MSSNSRLVQGIRQEAVCGDSHGKGKITTWNDDKGYGFIAPDDGGSQVFIHIKAFSNRNRRPEWTLANK